MLNSAVVAVYIPLLLVIVVICMMAFVRDRQRLITQRFLWLCSIIACWLATEVAFHLARNFLLSRILFDIKLAFVAFSAVQVFMLSTNFYQKAVRKRPYTLFLFVIPFITAVLSCTSYYHTLIRASIVVLETEPTHIIEHVRGAWFWVHSGYSYILMLASAVSIVRQHRRLPKDYRLPSTLLVIGVFVSLLCNLLVVTNIVVLDVDITLIGMSVALIFIYVAINTNEQVGFLILARDELFSYLEDCVFILDNNRRVIDYNQSAKQLLDQLRLASPIASFEAVTVHLSGHETGFESGSLAEEGADVVLAGSDPPVTYNVRERALRNKGGVLVGSFVRFSDVTRYKLLIDRLEESAGVDPLTGLANRRSYEMDRSMLDIPENLPLSVILGDVNGLKAVNDHQGHQTGDVLLRLAAQVISEACPKGATAYRLGGDEFLMLMPGTDSDGAKAIMRQITEVFSMIKRYPFSPSMALGHATKEHLGVSLDQLFDQADARMYSSKKARR